MTVDGDMGLEEARGWIVIGANCIGMKPQSWGHFVTVRHPGNSFNYSWTNPDGSTGSHRGIGGVAHEQPNGSFFIHYVDNAEVKLHELGWHVNKIKAHRDFREPPIPFGWCDLVRGIVPTGNVALPEVLVIDKEGTVR